MEQPYRSDRLPLAVTANLFFQRSLSTEKWNQVWNAWASLQGKCSCFTGTANPQGASEDVQPSFVLAHV